jgi:DnaK suppressor protein
MAKKSDKKKDTKAKSASKPVKKAAAPSKKTAAKPAAKKAAKPADKKPVKAVKKVSKPAPKKVVKPVAKKIEKKPVKNVSKPVSRKKEEPKKALKPAAKEITKKPAGKPIEAIAKKGKDKKTAKVKGKKKGKGGDDDDDIPAEEDDDSDVIVKDDYEKADDDDVLVGDLDEAGIVDLEGGGPPEVEEDEDEVPEKRGRGRRKKSEGKSHGNSMEAYIRNRPLQIDISKPLIKKSIQGIPKPFVNTKDNRSRYTDKELAEFKELILEKLKEAQMDYDLLKQTLSNEDNHGTDDTSPTFKLLEDGSDVMSKEETAQLAARQEKYIINLKNALVRIENKTYGICRVTGKLIPKERLRSVPHATLGIDAKLNQ